MSAVPVWIQVLQALLTPAIAVAVGVIAFMQWRTAHQKVVLDLFDRRLKVYNELEEIAAEIEINRAVTDQAAARSRQAFLQAKFLFGADAFGEINKFYKAVRRFRRIPTATGLYISEQENFNAMVSNNSSAIETITNFRQQMPNTFEAYMRMDQKLVRTPLEWLADSNRRRLSYADEKQR